MSEHRVQVSWNRESEGFGYREYNREHRWIFDHGVEVNASAAPEFLGKDTHVDPEQAFVAALSSCHMLTFLALCARKKIVVERYTDSAVGFLEKNEDGRLAITRVHLKPEVEFSEDCGKMTQDMVMQLHDKAHAECFIANSVTTRVLVGG